MAIKTKPVVEITEPNMYMYKKGNTSLPRTPTPYRFQKCNYKVIIGKHRAYAETGSAEYWLTIMRRGRNPDLATQCMNAAITKYRRMLDSNNGLIETIVERQKSIDMATTALQRSRRLASELLRDYRRAKRNPKVASKLAKKYPARFKRWFRGEDEDLSTIPEQWLAWQFGLIPTVTTLHDTFTLLVQPFPQVELFGKASRYDVETLDTSTYWSSRRDNFHAHVGGTLQGINHNVFLAQQVGAFSPSVLWDITPWSWFVDIFTNANEFIANLNPSPPGLIIGHTFNTMFYKTQFVRKHKPAWYLEGDGDVVNGDIVEVWRNLGVPNVTLELPNLRGLNVVNFSYAASALALTLKGFSKGRKSNVTH